MQSPLNDKEIDQVTDFVRDIYIWASTDRDKTRIDALSDQHDKIYDLLKKGHADMSVLIPELAHYSRSTLLSGKH